MTRRWSFAICACLAALGVGLLPSPGFAFGDGNASGGISNTGGSTAGGSGGTTSTASSKNARFYDETLNGFTCTGVAGTAGGVFGTAKTKVGAPSTVSIKVHRLSHNTTYNVNFVDATCVSHLLGTFTTDSHGRGSGTFTFTSTPTGNFTLVPPAGDSFQTKNLAF